MHAAAEMWPAQQQQQHQDKEYCMMWVALPAVLVCWVQPGDLVRLANACHFYFNC